MNYSCGLFFEGTASLEEAQDNKLGWFHDQLGFNPDMRVLDIGCGWGGCIDYLVREKGLKDVTGITLSRAQYKRLQEKDLPGANVACISYADYEPETLFDGLISIGMFEHLATPDQARTGESLKVYRNYFRKAWQWTKPGSMFGLQSVIGGRLPRSKKAVKELAWGTYTIFPGAISPRIEVIAAAVNPYWEIIELHTRREHYARTTEEWHKRLTAQEPLIRERWGDQIYQDYDRYLQACVTSFREGYQSLVQVILRRQD